MGEAGGQTPSQADQKSFAERAKQTVTRRDFLIGAGAGAATAVVVLGGAAVATKAVSPSTTTTTTTAVGQGPLPATMRRVALNIDGVGRDLVVDNRLVSPTRTSGAIERSAARARCSLTVRL